MVLLVAIGVVGLVRIRAVLMMAMEDLRRIAVAMETVARVGLLESVTPSEGQMSGRVVEQRGSEGGEGSQRHSDIPTTGRT